MKNPYIYWVIIVMVISLLAAGSVLAREIQLTESTRLLDTSSIRAANAPWANIEVDTQGDTGLYTSLAIHASLNRAYISYYDAINQEARRADYNGWGTSCNTITGWSCITVDNRANVGLYSSISIDPKTEGVGIAYHDATNGSLKYTFYKNPHLYAHSTPITIDRGIQDISSTGLHTSLKYNSNGQPFIAYYFDNPSGVDALMLAYLSYASGNCVNGDLPDEWRCETIISGEGLGQYASLVVIDDWEFHVAFYDAENGDLWYGTSIGDGNCGAYGTDWVCYPITGGVTDAGRYASMYVDDSGDFHIAYYDATTHELKYAVNVGSDGNCGVLGSAQCDTIDSMPVDTHPLGISIAEDAAGYPIIAYQSAFGSLNVARPIKAQSLPAGSGNCGPEIPFATWYCQTIYPSNQLFLNRHGDYLSIAVNPYGLATIAHYGFITSDGGNLMVAYQQFQDFLPLVMKNH